MKKKILLFMLTVILVLSNMTVFATENSGEDTSAEKEIVSVAIDTSLFYYNNFDNDAYRNVYDQLKDAASNFHNSTRNAEYREDSSGPYYKAFTINVTSKNWDVIGASGMQTIVYAFLADNPTYFWMSPSFKHATKSLDDSSVCYEVQILCYNDYANGSSRQVIKNNVDITISNYVKSLDENLPDYQKEYLIHNAIIDNTFFDTESENSNSGSVWTYSVDGVFNSKYKKATSFGYAKAFKSVMDELDIPCIYVEGNVKEPEDADNKTAYNSHAWNMVYLDDGWYVVDLAYDDPETTSGKNVLIYDYFNITSEKASDLEPASDWLPGIPVCTGTAHSLSSIQAVLEQENIWQDDNYNFIDKILDTYGISVVLISLGLILILFVALFRHIHNRHKQRKVEKIKNTKTVAIDQSELDNELRRPPLS